MRKRFLATLVFALAAGCATPEQVTRQFHAMGTTLDIEASASSREVAIRSTEGAANEVTATEERISTWKKDSELSRLNRSKPGVIFPITPKLHADLAAAFRCAELTDYAFHPGMGSLIELWGTRSTHATKTRPNSAKIRDAVAASHTKHFHLSADQAMRTHSGFRIEEGGIGKGIALDRAARVALAQGAKNIRLNFGGQILVTGVSEGPFDYEVAHPRHRSVGLFHWPVREGSLSTSGLSERGSHILDPRTGDLVESIGSVTVWSRSASDADCLSTAFLVMGREKTFEWLIRSPMSSPVYAAFAESAPGTNGTVQVHASCELKDQLTPSMPGAEFHFVCQHPARKL